MQVIYKRTPKGKRASPIKENHDRHLFINCPHCFEQLILEEKFPCKLVFMFRCGSYARMFFKQKTWAESIFQSKHCSQNVISSKYKK